MVEKTDFPWGHSKRYNDFSSHFKRLFKERVQKISINAGFTCPNRDGSISKGGCIYCDNQFKPAYCEPEKTVSQQIEQGIAFFAPKYKTQQYLAYFQAYTNTYADLSVLKKLYEEALQNPKIIGLVIATRPDCINEDVLAYLHDLAKSKYVVVEYGVESTCDETLELINRGHKYEEVEKAFKLTAKYGLHTGLHLILGLPGEDHKMMMQHAKLISQLPFETLKLHQLQIIKNTQMASLYENSPDLFQNYTAHEYIDLVIDFLEQLNPKIIVERFISESPRDVLISPRWGLKNFEFVNLLIKRIKERDTWQGKLFGQ